jgi:hypothetical protein
MIDKILVFNFLFFIESNKFKVFPYILLISKQIKSIYCSSSIFLALFILLADDILHEFICFKVLRQVGVSLLIIKRCLCLIALVR